MVRRVCSCRHTQAERVDRLNAELVKALHTPEVAERIRLPAYGTWTLAPKEFASFLRTAPSGSFFRKV